MKLEVKNNEYYQLQEKQGIILFDNFKEAVGKMKEAIKGNPGDTKLWRVKQENGKWAMIEVGYQELFEMLVKKS